MNMPGGAAAGGLQSYSALPPQSYSAAMQQQQTPIGMPNGHNSHGHRGVGQLMSMQQHGQQQPTTPMEPLPCSVGGVVALGAAALDSDTGACSAAQRSAVQCLASGSLWVLVCLCGSRGCPTCRVVSH